MAVTANTNCIMFSDTDSAEKALLVKEEDGGVRVYHLPGHDKVLSVGTWTLRDGLRCDLKDVNDETQQVIAVHASNLYHNKNPKMVM